MADDSAKLNIEVRVEGVPKAANDLNVVDSSIASGTKATNDLSDALDTTNQKIGELEERLRTAANGGLADSFDADSQAAEGLQSALGGLIKIMAGLTAGVLSFKTAQDAILASAKYEMLGIAMHQVGENAGYSQELLDQYAASLEKTGIAMTESRQLVTQLTSAQVELSKATQLARIAQDAAVIGGINSTEAFQRLVYGMTTGNALILRNIGIQVNFERAYDKMATSLNKTTAALTGTEKMQARVNAVMEQGVGISGAYEKSLESSYKMMTSIPRYVDNIQVLAGKVGDELFSQVIAGAYEAAKATESWLKQMDQTGRLEEIGKGVANTVTTLSGLIDDAVVAFVAYKVATSGAAVASSLFNGNLAYQLTLLRGSIAQFGLLRTALMTLAPLWPVAVAVGVAALYNLVTAETEADRITKQYSQTITGLKGSADEAARAIDTMTNKIAAMSKEQARFEMSKVQRELAATEHEFQRLKEVKGDFSAFMADIDMDFESPFADAIEQFRSGTITGEDFRRQVYAIGSTLDEEGQKAAGTLVDLSYAYKGLTEQDKLLRQQMAGTLENGADMATRWAKEQQKLAKATDEIGEALKRVDQKGMPKTLEDAYDLYTKYVAEVDKSRQTATEAARAQATLAVEIMRKTAAAEDARGAMAGMMGMDAAAANQAELAAEYFARAAVHYANARRIMQDADKLEADIPKITVTPVGGGGGGDNDISRMAYQASEAYERAAQATQQLRMENAQLTAELGGSGLGVALQKIASEYESKMEGIRKEQARLQEQMRQWGKKGNAGAEAAEGVRKAQEELALQRQLVEENRRLNEERARRNELEKELQAQIDYSRMIGDLRSMHDAEVQLLQVKMQSVNIEAERLALQEQMRQAEARRDLDVGGMLQTGFMEKFQESRQGFVDFFEQDIPDILTSFEQGFANSIGRAIVYSEDLKSSLYEVGRSALASLISGLVQLGIQWLVTATLGNAIAAAQVATMSPMASAMTSMWTTPAYLASVATFGGAAGMGLAALSIGMTGMKAMTAVSGAGFQEGGYTGDLPTDRIAGFVHGQEYVFDAPSVSRIGRATLDAMRAGEQLYNVTPEGWSGTGGSRETINTEFLGGLTLKLSVQNLGTPQTYDMEYVSSDEVRLICRDEIHKNVPGIVTKELSNPNSSMSSSFEQNYKVTRNR